MSNSTTQQRGEEKGLKYWQGVNQALHEAMDRDETVVVVGEDVGRPGGPYGMTRGLLDRFGDRRVRDTPISETVIAGIGVGAAAQGLRPVVEIMFFDFAMLAMDQIVNQAAKYRYFTAGSPLPLVIRTMCGAGGPNGAQHSQSLEAWFCHVPGLTVVMPSDAVDAKRLLAAAIRTDDPVLVIDTLGLVTVRAQRTGENDTVELGVAEVRRPGSDATVVATGRMVGRALEAAQRLNEEGIDVEVIDPRTLQPFDTRTIFASVARTGRLVVAHEAAVRFGWGAELCALAATDYFDLLQAPPIRVGAPFINVPTPPSLAEARIPSAMEIREAVKVTIGER